MKTTIKINPNDNVAVALEPLDINAEIFLPDQSLTLIEDIPKGHKFSLDSLTKGESVLKYGHVIGTTTAPIPKGAWVHTHNMSTNLGEILEYTYQPALTPFKKESPAQFLGYRRENNKVGIRNSIWIIPTVGCVNNVATSIKSLSQEYIHGNIDEIAAFSHPYGCSQMGLDQENTRKILANLINHPNAGGVLVLGLGCENCNIDTLKDYIGEVDPKRVRFLQTQDVVDEIQEGVALIKELIEYASPFAREPIGVDELIIGMKCGGSDGLSGITANPAVGALSDKIIAMGGSTILTEVPEMFGAETLLMNRCETPELFQETVHLINDFKAYFKHHNQTIYENPSPGNKDGGISTLEDKSFGCTQKSGSAPIVGVLSYAQPLQRKGLNLLNSPGNDLVASTALAASGAHMVLFTTGRGTPFACPVPTVKISSNSQLSEFKKNWIDFDCGTLVQDENMEDLSERFFAFVLEIASGKKSKSELMGFHDMAIFKQGVTL